MEKVEVIYKNIDEIIPYVNNPRNNKDAVDAVASSIKNFGFKVPVVIDGENEIVNGHTRILASKKLGLKEVPVIVASDLSPEQIKAFRLADNKVGELAEWDTEMLMVELDELAELDIDMTDFGFEPVDFEEENKEQKNTEPSNLDENTVIIITCNTEEELEETFVKLSEEGYQCQLSTF